MTVSLNRQMPRTAVFLVGNAAGLALLFILVVVPLLSHFADRSEEIGENAAQLAYLNRVIRGAQAMEQNGSHNVQPFLTGGEERVASADLQANLQAMASAKGAHVLGLRGLQGGRVAAFRTVAVGLEFEGSLGIVKDVIAEIEGQSPLLFITEASLRAAADGDGSTVRAELRVEGAMQESLGTQPETSEDRHAPELAGMGAKL